jgi:hypothetical protein
LTAPDASDLHDDLMVSEEVIGGLGRWFGTVRLADPPESAIAVLAELVRMLDSLRPRLLDPSESWVRSGRGWASAEVEIHLAHREDEEAEVDLFVGRRDALVAWLTAHEHVAEDDAVNARPWTTVVVDLIAAVLSGEYEVENRYRGRWFVRTRIVDVAVPGSERVVSQTGSLITSWLPWPGASRIERRRLDYGTQGR